MEEMDSLAFGLRPLIFALCTLVFGFERLGPGKRALCQTTVTKLKDLRPISP